MATITDVLQFYYADQTWRITADQYETLDWAADNPKKKPSLKTLENRLDEAEAKKQMDEIRRNRNRLLRESDWTQLKDIPEKISKPWADYRKKLRDIPEFFDDPDFVVFPDKPEVE